jgi:hypothetical protein
LRGLRLVVRKPTTQFSIPRLQGRIHRRLKLGQFALFGLTQSTGIWYNAGGSTRRAVGLARPRSVTPASLPSLDPARSAPTVREKAASLRLQAHGQLVIQSNGDRHFINLTSSNCGCAKYNALAQAMNVFNHFSFTKQGCRVLAIYRSRMAGHDLADAPGHSSFKNAGVVN